MSRPEEDSNVEQSSECADDIDPDLQEDWHTLDFEDEPLLATNDYIPSSSSLRADDIDPDLRETRCATDFEEELLIATNDCIQSSESEPCGSAPVPIVAEQEEKEEDVPCRSSRKRKAIDVGTLRECECGDVVKEDEHEGAAMCTRKGCETI